MHTCRLNCVKVLHIAWLGEYVLHRYHPALCINIHNSMVCIGAIPCRFCTHQKSFTHNKKWEKPYTNALYIKKKKKTGKASHKRIISFDLNSATARAEKIPCSGDNTRVTRRCGYGSRWRERWAWEMMGVLEHINISLPQYPPSPCPLPHNPTIRDAFATTNQVES